MVLGWGGGKVGTFQVKGCQAAAIRFIDVGHCGRARVFMHI